ncbi:MAG: extracellular solute-binding protein, partial [Candidatus Thorarchaeota archaeon]
MKKITLFKVFAVLVGFLMLFPTSSIIFPLIEPRKPQSSQGVALTIIVPDQQKPGVENVTVDFLASPLGNGVDSVTVISSGTTADDILTFLQSLMKSGTATATVIGLDTTWTAPFADNGWIINLDPYLEVNELDDYGPGIVSACNYNDKTYAYPYFMNLGVLYYRKDLMDEYFGVGGWSEGDFATWEGLNATANFILNNLSTPLKYPDLVGYIGQLDAYEGGVVNFVEWCGSNSAIKLIDNRTVNINTPNVTEAMEFIKALIPPQYTGVQGTPYIIPRYGLVYDEGSSVMKWIANESIFMRQWTFAYGSSEAQNIEFGIAPLPHFAGASEYKTSCIGGSILAVPSATTGIARQAAVNLTKFLGDTLAQERELTADAQPGPGYWPLGNFPALKSVYDNPPAGFEWIKNWSAQVNLTLSRPITLNYSQISPIIANYFSDLLSGNREVSDALEQMEKKIEEILIKSLLPESFTLLSTADNPDGDGDFSLVWSSSSGAANYSIYQYDKFITEINESLTLLANEITDLTLPLSDYSNDIYYFIVVAHNDYGDT